jgi:hypothetical protein
MDSPPSVGRGCHDSERSTAGLVVEIQWSEHGANSADFEQRRAGVDDDVLQRPQEHGDHRSRRAGPGDRWPTKDHHSWGEQLQTHSASPVHGPTPRVHVCLRPRYLTERSGARVERAGRAGRDAERGSGAGGRQLQPLRQATAAVISAIACSSSLLTRVPPMPRKPPSFDASATLRLNATSVSPKDLASAGLLAFTAAVAA